MPQIDSGSSPPRGRPSVLVFVAVYPPVFESSGPARSVSSMIGALGDEVDFHVVTRYRGGRPGLASNRWVERDGASVQYVTSLWRLIRCIVVELRGREFDVLYLNSVFGRSFTWLPLFARWVRLIRSGRVIVASRGEFSPGAMAIRSGQKRLFLSISKRLGVLRAVEWHVTNDYEHEHLLELLGGSDVVVHVAQNITDLQQHPPSVPMDDAAEGRPLHAAFLARISPKKNLDGALRAASRCTRPTRLVVAGPISDPGYWARCQDLIRGLPSHVEVEHIGEVPAKDVVEFLASFDVTFLPTHGENYGHTIAESLLASTPVVISDRTPWSWIADEGAGRVLAPDDHEGFAAALDELAQRSPAEVRAGREAAHRVAAEHIVGAGVHEHRVMLSAPPVVRSTRRSRWPRSGRGDR